MPTCSFGHHAEEVRKYKVIEAGKPSKVLDEGMSCPKHDEMIGAAKYGNRQDKRIEAAQRFRETSTPNEHTEKVMESFELDKPANEHKTGISRTGHHLPRRDDRDNIERGFGRDLLVHASMPTSKHLM
jgi:hypothetical protein